MADLQFLLGPLSHRSSWVEAFGYGVVGRSVGVVVQFKDGASVIYPGTTETEYAYLRKARSKGKAIWARFYHLDYEYIDF